ncbi:HPC2-domain-containing protein [Diplogelasinospora grovesii]|uniref:HPC2-domain-containing protein n=1 Tax=Diplogelasinospora grovesii TaxID=303347 RepID=A0AAN6NA76_9PEZI|nr:HPC2-domain-containing protein [Diplogelasinospora grovesii]
MAMQHYSSSPTSLSSPPSAISEPGSPTRCRANIEMSEIIVDPGSAHQYGLVQQTQPGYAAGAAAIPTSADGTQLTAAGLPRKKPGRKPAAASVKPKAIAAAPADGSSTNTEQAIKPRRQRKSKDPSAPLTVPRKRKAAGSGEDADSDVMEIDSRAFSAAAATRQPKITELTSMRMSMDARPTTSVPDHALKVAKRESFPGSMQSILNDDEPPLKPPPPPVAPNRHYDPVRGNYDPVRETMITRDPYGTGPLGSPRAPTTQPTNRASASPSIASLVDPPPPSAAIVSPVPSHTSYSNAPAMQSRFQESTSMPPSPSQPTQPVRAAAPPQHLVKPTIVEVKRVPPPPPPPPPAAAAIPAPPPAKASASAQTEVTKTNSFTSLATVPAAVAATLPNHAAPAPLPSKKLGAVVQKERDTQKKASSNSSSPKMSSLKDALPAIPNGSGRSILDFGKASPGEENEAPSIVLHIPLNGETNKYVNFMRMAEERYGWDALHPRLAANRDRKARIAAATAALEKNGSGRESGDEMDEDLQSDGEGSNVEMGGMGNGNGNGGPVGGGTSGPDGAPEKKPRKKRNFKEDEYDKDDDFVDDSELLWEEQAAASRDGFFVYSGPLIPEVEKPAVPTGPPRRGRGGGRGSRGGRGGAARNSEAGATGATGTTGTGRGRGGGPGSRGGQMRKPRITKLEKEQRDREKAERERAAQMSSATKTGGVTSAPYSLPQIAPGAGAGAGASAPTAASSGVTV